MYPYLWIRLRKLLKGIWHRHFCRKRERSTSFSSLQECLEQPPNRNILWRNWFLVLLIAPPIYYFASVQRLWQHDLSNVQELRPSPEQIPNKFNEKTIMTSILYEQSTDDINLQTATPHYNGSVTGPWYNHTFRGNIEIQQTNRIVSNVGAPKSVPVVNIATNVTMPWCRFRINKSDASVIFSNISSDQAYRELVKVGGYHVPQECRPRHKVAILVPFRDRQTNLAMFLFNIHPFLITQMLEYRIFVIEQSGTGLFNKGRLYNAGYLEAGKFGNWDCLVFHDVDLLPMSKLILYSCPIWPRHMCATVVDNGNSFSAFHTFFGGVSSMTKKQFVRVNGYSNLYWGWGGEDTDMFWRIRGAGFPMVRYQKDIAKYLSLPHNKIEECKNRNELVRTAIARYSYDGLTTLQYKVISLKFLHLYTHILVDVDPVSNKTSK